MPRKISRKGLIKKLDKVAKEIMFKRDGRHCVMCGSSDKLGWGHVFSSGTHATRWDMFNIHVQCWPCNYRHVRDQYPYFEWFENKYGKKAFRELRFRFKNPKRLTRLDLEDKLEELTKLLKEQV